MRSGSGSLILGHSDYGISKKPIIHPGQDNFFVTPWSQGPDRDHPKETHIFFISFLLSNKNEYHTLELSTSTSGLAWFSFSVIKFLSNWRSSKIVPLQVFPCPHFLVPLNRFVSDEPGLNNDAPGLLLVTTALCKVVYSTFIEPKPSLDTSRGGSPRKSCSSKLFAIARKKSFTVCRNWIVKFIWQESRVMCFRQVYSANQAVSLAMNDLPRSSVLEF